MIRIGFWGFLIISIAQQALSQLLRPYITTGHGTRAPDTKSLNLMRVPFHFRIRESSHPYYLATEALTWRSEVVVVT